MTGEAGPAGAERRPRVLCVDDEPAILDSLRRQLYAQFVIVGVGTGTEALALLSEAPRSRCSCPTCACPVWTARRCYQARAVQPDTVRVLLTGQADMEDAVAAVNDGNIFRFLIKPCPRPVLVESAD